MKFIHIADVHFDCPFSNLQERGLSEKRRLEQRNAFKKVIDYIKENNIGYLFICGDLYEQEYVRKSTIDYINKLFQTIPNTKSYNPIPSVSTPQNVICSYFNLITYSCQGYSYKNARGISP